jgi:hypothetical protein
LAGGGEARSPDRDKPETKEGLKIIKKSIAASIEI